MAEPWREAQTLTKAFKQHVLILCNPAFQIDIQNQFEGLMFGSPSQQTAQRSFCQHFGLPITTPTGNPAENYSKRQSQNNLWISTCFAIPNSGKGLSFCYFIGEQSNELSWTYHPLCWVSLRSHRLRIPVCTRSPLHPPKLVSPRRRRTLSQETPGTSQKLAAHCPPPSALD